MNRTWASSFLSISAIAAGAAACMNAANAAPPDALIKAAKQEGQLTVIALPHDWCGYGPMIAAFQAKYGIKINELNPDAGSGDEVEAIKANKGNKGPQAPDVIDVGLSFGPTAKSQGLLQPYKVSTWKSIPDSVKDPEGYWYGDYYGVLAFEVNADMIDNAPTLFRSQATRVRRIRRSWVCTRPGSRWRRAMRRRRTRPVSSSSPT